MRGDEIDRALASAQAGDFPQARAILERAEHERMQAMVKARHDMGNALSIAQSSIEAMLDAVAEVEPRRLERLLEIVKDVSASLYEVTADAGAPVNAVSLQDLSKVKDVRLILDTAHSSSDVQRILMQAIRHAVPHSTIRVGDSHDSTLIISLRPRSNEAFITSMNGVRQIGNDGDYIRVRIEL